MLIFAIIKHGGQTVIVYASKDECSAYVKEVSRIQICRCCDTIFSRFLHGDHYTVAVKTKFTYHYVITVTLRSFITPKARWQIALIFTMQCVGSHMAI